MSVPENAGPNKLGIQSEITLSKAFFILLEEAVRQGEQLSQTDSLTGIGNRRALDNYMEYRVAHANRRSTKPDTEDKLDYFIMTDLDEFKNVNDQHGHMAGDSVLQQFASLLVASERSDDRSYRYGGEEFAVILEDTTREAAETVTERLRQKIESEIFTDGIKLTASFGISAITKGLSLEDIYSASDGALYQAKEEGRNRSVFVQPKLN